MENNKISVDKNNSVSTKKIFADSLKGFYKNHKVISKVLIALSALILAALIGICVLNINSVQVAIFNSFMPQTITDEESGIVFYRESNPDYGEAEGEQSINVYYYPENDTSREKIYLKNGVYLDSDGNAQMYVTAGFTLSVLLKIQNAIKSLGWIAAGLAVAVVVLLIVAWYNSFKKQELARKEAYRKAHPHNK